MMGYHENDELRETQGDPASMLQDLLEGLNPAQREAVITTEGPVRVLAGAGSGKTRALVRRFAYLVLAAGVLPENILCVTFTNKAAGEMRTRIRRLTGDNDTGYINTFHGFCVSVLHEDISCASYPKSFLVLDNPDIDQMLELIYEERGLSLRDMTYSKARDMIEILKLKDRPDYYVDMIEQPLAFLKEKYDQAETVKDIIFYGYLYHEKKNFGLDYNDLLKFTLHIFEKHEDVKLKWQKRLAYIMIDEFQDIDAIQYELMEVLAGYHGNLFVVGDPDQTIYTWRGADIRYLLEFPNAFPGTTDIYMMQNYRSTPEIIGCVNSLIEKNHIRAKKALLPTLPSAGNAVECFYAKDAADEAAWICGEIKALLEAGTPYRDMTVLYRAHYLTRTLEQVFDEKKIPFTIYSGVRFFDRAEVKDALAYLRMVIFRDDLSFRRICNKPKRNIGKRRLGFLEDFAQENDCTLYTALQKNYETELFRGTGAAKFLRLIERSAGSAVAGRPVSDLLAEILDDSGYEKMLRTEGSQERMDNLAELKASVYEFETSCGEECSPEYYLSHVALLTNQDAKDRVDKVKFMTIHAAKGLEFPVVFLCGLNEGILPSRKTLTLPAMEEERRLAFVAMTRAEKRLYLSEAAGFHPGGGSRVPSRFLLDIDPELLHFVHPPEESLIRDARRQIEASTRKLLPADPADTAGGMPPGTRVRHMIFGEGTITEVLADEQAFLIQFDSLPTARKLSFRAPLETI